MSFLDPIKQVYADDKYIGRTFARINTYYMKQINPKLQ
jgi:hypothetical protein